MLSEMFTQHVKCYGIHVVPTRSLVDNPIPFFLLTLQLMMKLSGLHLRIPMNGENAWELNKSHIRVACRHIVRFLYSLVANDIISELGRLSSGPYFSILFFVLLLFPTFF